MMLSHIAAIGALALLLLGCAPRSPGSDAPLSSVTAPPSVPVSTGAPMIPSQLHARLFSAGFGGVGPATPAPAPDAWVSLIVDIDSSGALSGVEIVEIELVDVAGKVVARAVPPWLSRRDPGTLTDAGQRADRSDAGTLPFDGNARPGEGLRLHVRAPLDTRLDSLARRSPARFRARLLAHGDPGIPLEGPVDAPWATAGPAGPR
jgi:hypothetical protein